MRQDKARNVSGQLTQQFHIPPYAWDMLYVVTDDGSALAHGKQGDFTLAAPPQGVFRITWGGADGPTLAFWSSAVDPLNVGWDGRVKVSGFIERLHALEVGGAELIIVEVVGGPLPADHIGLPSLNDMRSGIFARPPESEPLGKNQAYPFIILAETNLAALAQDALVSGLAVDASGSLASEAGGWHEIVGLPLLLDSLTLLAP